MNHVNIFPLAPTKWLKICRFFFQHLLLLLLLVMGGAQSLIQAQNFTISPVNTQLALDGGEEKFLEYTLTNEHPTELLIHLEAQSFVPDELYGQPILSASNEFPYLSLYENNQEASAGVTLPPQSQKKIRLKFAPPLGIAEKEFPLTLFFVATPLQKTEQTEIGFKIGSNVIIRTDKSNLDKSRLKIADFNLPYLLDSFKPVSTQIKVLNQGSTSTLIKGRAQLVRKNGELIKTWDLHPDLILGHSSRLARGINTIDAVGNQAFLTDFTFPLPLIGEYRFEAQVYSGYAQETEPQPYLMTITFLALPYWLILSFFIILLILLLLTVIMKKRHQKQAETDLTEKVDQMKAQKKFFAT